MTGEQFRTLRKSIGWTQGKLSSELGISILTVHKAERSVKVRERYAAGMVALCRRHNVPLAHMLLGNTQMAEDEPETDALKLYNDALGLLAALYRKAKQADMAPSRPPGRPSVKAIRAVAQRNHDRDVQRPMIAERLAQLDALPTTVEQRRQIDYWSGTTPENLRYLRDFVDGMADGSIRTRTDPRITLPLEPIE